MRRILSLLLVITMVSMAWTPAQGFAEDVGSIPDFKGLNDPSLLPYMEGTLYEELVSSLDSSEYFVENVSAIYISQEYLDELEYNSRANVFFGYTLAELNEQFEGTKYIFTLGDHDETVVQPFEGYDDTFERVIHNVAVGTGVILVCVTVSALSAGVGAYAVTMVFACAAKTGAACAVGGAAFGSISAGVVTGIQTGDMDAALKAAALAGSEGYKWGAISGALSGGYEGLGKVSALKGANLQGLTVDQAAKIQLESKYPVDVIKNFKTMEQYDICKRAGLKPEMINGKTALLRDIDLKFVDEMGRTNLQRMQEGLAALDPTGQSYQLHHIGQKMDSTLAILTEAEHMQGGNNLIWHELGKASEITRSVFDKQRAAFWKNVASILGGG